jgi:hypothetical protein
MPRMQGTLEPCQELVIDCPQLEFATDLRSGTLEIADQRSTDATSAAESTETVRLEIAHRGVRRGLPLAWHATR